MWWILWWKCFNHVSCKLLYIFNILLHLNETTTHHFRRTWEALGKVDRIEAMREYTSIVDKILPGWDQESEIPISKQEKSWTKDQNVDACGTCGNSFTLQNRRHHVSQSIFIYQYSIYTSVPTTC
jgi:hypothetical protein